MFLLATFLEYSECPLETPPQTMRDGERMEAAHNGERIGELVAEARRLTGKLPIDNDALLIAYTWTRRRSTP